MIEPSKVGVTNLSIKVDFVADSISEVNLPDYIDKYIKDKSTGIVYHIQRTPIGSLIATSAYNEDHHDSLSENVYVGPLESSPQKPNRPILMILRNKGASAEDTSFVIRE